MSVVVVTEGISDMRFLEPILNAALPHGSFNLRCGNGKSSAVSLARTVLAATDERVALILDADTNNADAITEEQLILSDSLGMAGARNRFGIILAVPELEVALFLNPHTEKIVFGKTLDSQQRLEARFEPKNVASRLLGGRNRSPFFAARQKINAHPEVFLSVPFIKKLIAFIGAKTAAAA